MKIKNLQENLSKELVTTNSDVTLDLVELGLDSIFQEGILKEIPIVKTIVAICKTGLNIKERFFAQKILKFIYEFKKEDINNCDFLRFKADMENYEYNEKVTEKLIIILDKLEELNKTYYISKLFKGFIQQKISWNDFCNFSKYIGLMTNDDFDLLNYLSKYRTNGVRLSTSDKKNLESNSSKLMMFNFVKMDAITGTCYGTIPVTIIHSLTADGIKFISCFN